VLLLWVVAGAHNDLLMMLAMSGAVALVACGREAGGAATAVVGAAVKLSAVLLALVIATARGLDWVEGAALALVVAAAASGWLMPWYTVWALPLAVLVRRPRALIAVLALQGLVLAHVLAATV